MIRRGGGSVLFIASMASLIGIPGVVAYSAAKSAYVGMVRAMATDPSPGQYATIEESGQLAPLGPSETIRFQEGTAVLRFALPRQAVSLLVVEWSPSDVTSGK